MKKYQILLNDKGIAREMGLPYPLKEEMEHENYAVVDINDLRPLVKATGKKILIKLQAIYNIPDGGAEDKRMGEFLQELQEEVK